MRDPDDRATSDRGVENQRSRTRSLGRRMGGTLYPFLETQTLIEFAIRDHALLHTGILSEDPIFALAVLENLILSFRVLDDRIRKASIDEDGRPELDGITWDRNSPTAGSLMDINPFQNYDYWIVLRNRLRPLPQAPRQRRRRRENTPIWGDDPTPEESTYRGSVPANQDQGFRGDYGSQSFIGEENTDDSHDRYRWRIRLVTLLTRFVAPFTTNLVSSLNSAWGYYDFLNGLTEISKRKLRQAIDKGLFVSLYNIAHNWSPSKPPRLFRVEDFVISAQANTHSRIAIRRWIIEAVNVGADREQREREAWALFRERTQEVIEKYLNPQMRGLDSRLPAAITSDILTFDRDRSFDLAIRQGEEIWQEARTETMKDIFKRAASQALRSQ